MKRILLIVSLVLITAFSYGQNRRVVSGDTLKIRNGGKFGGNVSVNGRVTNMQDPLNLLDGVNLQYLQDNVVVGDVEFVDFQVNELNPIYKQARMWYDSLRAEIVFYDRVIDLKFGTVSELSIRVVNNSGGEITKGDMVYPTGVSGGFTTIDLAQADAYSTSRPVGLAKNTMLNGEEGWVMLRGTLDGVNTSLLSGGVFYLSPTIAGDKTSTLPSGGDFIIRGGAVAAIGVSDGIIQVDPFTNEYTAETISPRGWPSDVVASTILAPNGSLRTFSIIGTGYVYEDGIKYSFDNPSVIWDDTEGTVDFYFNKGVLTSVNNLTESQVRSTYTTSPGVARMYWDALNDTIIFVNDMRHTFDMNGNTWSTFWDYHKCVVLDGLGLVDIQTGGTGNDAADAQFGHGSGVIRNQDIITSIPDVLSTTGYTVFYREGTAEWRSQDSPGFPILTTGTGLAAWNEDVLGVWQQTEVLNGDFVLYHLFVSNTLGDKTGTVMGQNDYGSLAGARAGALTEVQDLLFSQFPISELAPVATVIFETRTNYGNTVQSRTRQSTDPVTGLLVDYIDWTKTDVAGGSTGGTGASSFDDLTDTPSVKTGSAGKAAVVNGTEDALIYSDVVTTINGESPQALGNYNITSTAGKIGEDVTIGTSGTGIDAVFSVADNDNVIGNEFQNLSNSKLNNDITIEISDGVNTTVTNLVRNDFANILTAYNTFSGGIGSSGGTTTRFGSSAANVATGLRWTGFGWNAGSNNTTGVDWTAVGGFSGSRNIIGNNWTTVGFGAGSFLIGGVTEATDFENSVYVGEGTEVSANGVTNENVFGWQGEGKGSNTISFGNSAITDNYFNGNVDADSYSISGTDINAGGLSNVPYLNLENTYTQTQIAPFFNATTAFSINGTDIDIAGTLPNVAYKNQNNNFTSGQDITGNLVVTGSGEFVDNDIEINNTDTGLILNQVLGSYSFRSADASGSGVGIACSMKAISSASSGSLIDLVFGIRNTTAGQDLERLRVFQGGVSVIGDVTATVDVNCVDLNYSGSLNPVSDERMKDSINQLQFNKDKYLRLNPIFSYYNYDLKKEIHNSFLAQELEGDYPNLVKHSDSKVVIDNQIVEINTLDSIAQLNITNEQRLHTIRPMSIIPINTLAAQKALIKCDSLQLIVDENKLQIQVLKSLLQNLTDRVDALEN